MPTVTAPEQIAALLDKCLRLQHQRDAWQAVARNEAQILSAYGHDGRAILAQQMAAHHLTPTDSETTNG